MKTIFKFEMAQTHRFSLLLIILISGFKLGINASIDGSDQILYEGSKECILRLKPDWSFPSPLIFTLNGTLCSASDSLHHPTGNRDFLYDGIFLKEGVEVLLSCNPNYFRDNSAVKDQRVVCKEDSLLVVNGEEKDFVSELSCEAQPIEEIITPVSGCPMEMKSIEYGYTNPIKNKSYVLGESCYSARLGRTLFVHTRLRSPHMDVQELALKIKNGVYFRQKHPTSFYRNELLKALRREEHEEFIKQTLGLKSVPKIGIKLLVSFDFLTHKQYQWILKFAWNNAFVQDDMENLKRLHKDIAGLKLNNLDLYAGTHGVLSLKNNTGHQVEIFLKEDKFPIPKFIWYVLRSGNKAIAFAISNRRFMSEKDRQKDSFCKSKCEEVTWIHSLLENDNYKDAESGFVLCCEFNEFVTNVSEMPKIASINEFLT